MQKSVGRSSRSFTTGYCKNNILLFTYRSIIIFFLQCPKAKTFYFMLRMRKASDPPQRCVSSASLSFLGRGQHWSAHWSHCQPGWTQASRSEAFQPREARLPQVGEGFETPAEPARKQDRSVRTVRHWSFKKNISNCQRTRTNTLFSDKRLC